MQELRKSAIDPMINLKTSPERGDNLLIVKSSQNFSTNIFFLSRQVKQRGSNCLVLGVFFGVSPLFFCPIISYNALYVSKHKIYNKCGKISKNNTYKLCSFCLFTFGKTNKQASSISTSTEGYSQALCMLFLRVVSCTNHSKQTRNPIQVFRDLLSYEIRSI